MLFFKPITLFAFAFSIVSCTLTPRAKDPFGGVDTKDSNVDVSALGSITLMDADSGYVIAAPHGKFDLNTDTIVSRFCAAIHWDCLIAQSFRSAEHPINVNRPTEGVNLASGEESRTPRAEAVYAKYLASFSAITANTTPKLYVEIHGNNREESKELIEVAIVGIEQDRAGRIRALLNTALLANGIEDVHVAIEGLDEIYFGAHATKTIGILSIVKPALHMEFPKNLRMDRIDATVNFLKLALPQVTTLEFQ